MECEQCRSDNLEVIKQEHKQKYNIYYNDFVEYEVLHFRCKDCGLEFTECV